MFRVAVSLRWQPNVPGSIRCPRIAAASAKVAVLPPRSCPQNEGDWAVWDSWRAQHWQYGVPVSRRYRRKCPTASDPSGPSCEHHGGTCSFRPLGIIGGTSNQRPMGLQIGSVRGTHRTFSTVTIFSLTVGLRCGVGSGGSGSGGSRWCHRGGR